MKQESSPKIWVQNSMPDVRDEGGRCPVKWDERLANNGHQPNHEDECAGGLDNGSDDN